MDEPVSRRTFLAATLGVAATAACGRIGGDGLPTDSVTFDSFPSNAMGRSVDFGLWRPRASEPTAAIVCLHGRRGNHRYAFSSIGVHDAVRKAGLPFAVAAVHGGTASYWHGRRRDGTDSGRLVREEFVDVVRARFGRPALPIALLGWSMGGYGALLAAARAPTTFIGVAAASSALWLRPGDSARGAFDDAEDFERHDVFDLTDVLSGVPIRIDCGEGDPFSATNRAMLERLPHAAGGLRPGGHDMSFWRGVLPDQLREVARWIA